MRMKKFLTVVAAVFLVSLLAVIAGSTAVIVSRNIKNTSITNTKIGVDEIAELLKQEALVEAEEVRPSCLLFGHQFKEGMICLNSHKEYDIYPDGESNYYEFIYCEHCGYFYIVFVTSNRLGSFPE